MKISSPLLWRIALIILALAFLAEIGVVWISGEKETNDAFSNGRRLLISLENGEVKGKIISEADFAKEKAPEQNEESSKAAEAATSENLSNTENTTNNEASTEQTSESKPAEPKPAVEPEKTAGTSEQPAPPPTEQVEVINTITQTDEKVELPPLPTSKTPVAPFNQDLAEKSESGMLPKISADGKKPWKQYSKTLASKPSKPMVAIVVTGIGSNSLTSEHALRLHEAINLSLSPYSKNINEWAEKARSSGHETLIDMPMEASNYPANDPGPLGLMVSGDQNGNEKRIKILMAHNFPYIGFLTPQDEVFSANNELFKSFMQILSGRGLALVIGKPPAKNETKEIIEKGNTASVIADTLIDEELTPVAINARLSLLEQTAKQNGYAVGIAHSYPLTIKQIGEWAPKAEENGVVIVPVSAIIAKRF